MRIHFRSPLPERDPKPVDLNSSLDLIRAASDLKISQVHELINTSVSLGKESLAQPNKHHYIPCIHRHHLAFQGLQLIRQNSLVLDAWQVRDRVYYYQHHGDTNENRLHFYRRCDDPVSDIRREPLPQDLSSIIYMDFKLSSMTNKEQLNILDMWLHSNSPIKLLHVDVNEVEQVGCFDLLEQIRNITWSTNLFLDLWDRTPHFQNTDSVLKIAQRLEKIIKFSVTAEFHSAPISNVSGLCYLYDLKDPLVRPIRYFALNRTYATFIDNLRNNKIKGQLIAV